MALRVVGNAVVETVKAVVAMLLCLNLGSEVAPRNKSKQILKMGKILHLF